MTLTLLKKHAKILGAAGIDNGHRGYSSIGRTSPCQGEGRGFESHCPLFKLLI
jgi:hypothetical protein